MSSYRVIFKRVISKDGQAIAEARCQVITANDSDSTVTQFVTVHTSATSASSSSSCSARVAS